MRRHAVVPFLALLALLTLAPATPASSADEAALWAALKSGNHVAMMRHALAPGTGDPMEVVIGDCSTQRNLSDTGRDQARRIGARFRANGIAAADVFTSQWCRCEETAELLDLGPVTALPPLNSFFRRFERRGPQTEALRDWIAARDLSGVTVLVTHQVNITALTDVFPSSGEMVILRREADGTLRVVGTLETDA